MEIGAPSHCPIDERMKPQTMNTLIFAILLPVLTIGTVGTYANAGVQSHMMEQVAAGGLLGDYSLVLNLTN